MNNPTLRKIQKKLKNYFTYFKHDDILVISEDKADMPFAYIIRDKENYPDCVLMAFALDYCNSAGIAQIVMDISKVETIQIAESFYIAETGLTHWGQDAEKRFAMDLHFDLESLEPINETLN
jgi:hypothetical protein